MISHSSSDIALGYYPSGPHPIPISTLSHLSPTLSPILSPSEHLESNPIDIEHGHTIPNDMFRLPSAAGESHETDPLLLRSKLHPEAGIMELRRRGSKSGKKKLGIFYRQQNDHIESL